MFELMELPFKKNALEPYVSVETLSFHYDKHHKAYVDKVNELIVGTEFQDMSLEEIIDVTYGKSEYVALYNNAGQVYNHNVYWNSVGFSKRMEKSLKDEIIATFGTLNVLRCNLVQEIVKCFGSGWVWLVRNKSGELEIITTRNGDTPLVLGYEVIFNIDVWEHAYYLDYQNRRKDYAEAFVEKLIGI